MKKYSIIFLLLTVGSTIKVFAQHEFDFWIGKWDLTWTNTDGSTGQGTNHIEKILDDKVIQEHFESTGSDQYAGFKGTSISVYNPRTKQWHQAWADNQGSYLNFIGEIDGDRKIFKTGVTKINDQEVISRMVFYNISNDSLTWDWESSKDSGKSWQLSWRINYRRAE